MKELSIEEKAKAYDEAIERLRSTFYDNNSRMCEEYRNAVLKIIEPIFPELKKSEDELARKEMLEYCYKRMNNEFPSITIHQVKRWLAWLEKQEIKKHDVFNTCDEKYGCVNPCSMKLIEEQKPADKVESKFKVGDWLQYRDAEPFLVKGITPKGYVNGNALLPFEWENEAHIWTIQDAKDGDVFAVDDETIVIFKDLYNSTTFHSYCHIEEGTFSVSQDDMPDWWEGEGFHPATKEQCNLLFQKMKEAGYEWDSEKKELRKIEQKPASGEEGYDAMINKLLAVINLYYDRSGNDLDKQSCISFLKSLKDRVQLQPRQEWSEEDERMISDIDNCIKNLPILYETIKINGEDKTTKQFVCSARNWLKSFKDKVQPKQEWSKEDKRHIEKLILNVNAKEFPDEVNWLISLHEKIAPPYWDKEDEEMLNQAIQEVEYALNDKNIAFSGTEPVLLWLKHLRPQNRWKPSEEQMDALLVKIPIEDSCNKVDNILKSLYSDLKKLK